MKPAWTVGSWELWNLSCTPKLCFCCAINASHNVCISCICGCACCSEAGSFGVRHQEVTDCMCRWGWQGLFVIVCFKHIFTNIGRFLLACHKIHYVMQYPKILTILWFSQFILRLSYDICDWKCPPATLMEIKAFVLKVGIYF